MVNVKCGLYELHSIDCVAKVLQIVEERLLKYPSQYLKKYLFKVSQCQQWTQRMFDLSHSLSLYLYLSHSILEQLNSSMSLCYIVRQLRQSGHSSLAKSHNNSIMWLHKLAAGLGQIKCVSILYIHLSCIKYIVHYREQLLRHWLAS